MVKVTWNVQHSKKVIHYFYFFLVELNKYILFKYIVCETAVNINYYKFNRSNYCALNKLLFS